MEIKKKAVPLQPQSREMLLIKDLQAEIAQLVEHNLAKVGVAGPSPVFRSIFFETASSFILCIGIDVSNIIIMERWRNW